jgi:acetyl esterase/lipase
MIRLIILLLFLALSMLVIFKAPAHILWYISILVTEFSWVLILLVLALLFWNIGDQRFALPSAITGIVAIIIFLVPYAQAWQISGNIEKEFGAVFKKGKTYRGVPPFNPMQVFTGINSRKIRFRTIPYDPETKLTLDLYPAEESGARPCILVIHGGSWAAGDSKQLPELNSVLAKTGYHVASINYQLAPTFRFPAPVENVRRAIQYLKEHASELSIAGDRFVLLGRSAGGQVALLAAYTLNDPAIKGIINFYGPTDMVWGYQNPTNPLVLNSRKIMEDYIGGTLSQLPRQYKQSSATETVSAQSPPTLMIFGQNDPLVSPKHGAHLSAKLKARQIPHYTFYLPWATHGFDYTLNGPGGQLSTWMVKRFLAAVL